MRTGLEFHNAADRTVCYALHELIVEAGQANVGSEQKITALAATASGLFPDSGFCPFFATALEYLICASDLSNSYMLAFLDTSASVNLASLKKPYDHGW